MIVLPDSTFCMMTWLLLQPDLGKSMLCEYVAGFLPDNTRSLANGDLDLRHVHFLVQPVLNFGG